MSFPKQVQVRANIARFSAHNFPGLSRIFQGVFFPPSEFHQKSEKKKTFWDQRSTINLCLGIIATQRPGPNPHPMISCPRRKSRSGTTRFPSRSVGQAVGTEIPRLILRKSFRQKVSQRFNFNPPPTTRDLTRHESSMCGLGWKEDSRKKVVFSGGRIWTQGLCTRFTSKSLAGLQVVFSHLCKCISKATLCGKMVNLEGVKMIMVFPRLGKADVGDTSSGCEW